MQTLTGGLGVFPNPFFGTSAAAPHAAAIAALVRQVNPSFTAAQVIQTMADTAVDLGAAGYDTISGAGRYDTLGAVYTAFTPATPNLTAGSDLGWSDTDNYTNETTPTFTDTVPAASCVRLFVDGVQTNVVQLAAGATAYSLTPGALTAGQHNFSIRVAPNSAIVIGNNSNPSSTLQITIDTRIPTVATKEFRFDNVPAQSVEWTFNEDISGFLNLQDLTLTNTTTSTSIGATSSIRPVTAAHFTFPQFPAGILPDGNYTATLSTAGVTDKAGNPLPADSMLDFYVLAGDANRDCVVDISDLAILATNWQASVPAPAQPVQQVAPGHLSSLILADSGDADVMA